MSRAWILSVPDGAEIIEYLEDYLAREQIKEAAIVGCIGLLEELRIHYPVTVDRPPQVRQETLSGAAAINGGTGTVHGGKVHLHVSLRIDGKSLSGHLEMGRVFHYCEVILTTLD